MSRRNKLAIAFLRFHYLALKKGIEENAKEEGLIPHIRILIILLNLQGILIEFRNPIKENIIQVSKVLYYFPSRKMKSIGTIENIEELLKHRI
jgi:hypothetical protein